MMRLDVTRVGLNSWHVLCSSFHSYFTTKYARRIRLFFFLLACLLAG